MKKPTNPKERNLIKGAIRRVFSRSDLRREALQRASIVHSDPLRPRVTKWVFCANCGVIFPSYLAQVDHILPLVPVNRTLNEMSWDEVVDRAWCDVDNLAVLDKDCHKLKSKEENQERRRIKNEKS